MIKGFIRRRGLLSEKRPVKASPTLHPFGGAKLRLLRRSKKAPLRVNPERNPGL